MAKVYASLIRKGRKTIEDVPEILREEVKAILGITDIPEEQPTEPEIIPDNTETEVETEKE